MLTQVTKVKHCQTKLYQYTLRMEVIFSSRTAQSLWGQLVSGIEIIWNYRWSSLKVEDIFAKCIVFVHFIWKLIFQINLLKQWFGLSNYSCILFNKVEIEKVHSYIIVSFVTFANSHGCQNLENNLKKWSCNIYLFINFVYLQ